MSGWQYADSGFEVLRNERSKSTVLVTEIDAFRRANRRFTMDQTVNLRRRNRRFTFLRFTLKMIPR